MVYYLTENKEKRFITWYNKNKVILITIKIKIINIKKIN